MKKELSPHAKHVLKLINRDKKDGWTSVSEQLFTVLKNAVPSELCIFEKLEYGGRAKLTADGEKIIFAMGWL